MRRGFQSNQLPVFESEFVGRRKELEMIGMALETHSLVSIVGPGGMGKTRLAVQIAQIHASQFQHGVVFISLANINTREALAATLVSALHLHIAPSTKSALSTDSENLGELFDYVAEFLNTQDLLLIFDHIDQLHEQARFFHHLSRLNGPKLITTARARIGLANEFSFDLHGLPYHNPLYQHQPLSELLPAEQLFVQSVRQINASFAPTADEIKSIQQICQMADGMPLAVELAASWTRLLPIQFIANQISQNLDWLTSSLAVSRNTQYSIRAILDDFWHSLSREEQQQLSQLSVFQDGFECDMAKTLAGASLFFLSALAQRGLLARNAKGRYFLHPLLNQYASEQLAQSPHDYQTRLRHAELMRDLSQPAKAESVGPQQGLWLARIQIELGNLREAITWSLAQKQLHLALQILVNLESVWESLAPRSEVCAWLENALQDHSPESALTQHLHEQALQLYRRCS